MKKYNLVLIVFILFSLIYVPLCKSTEYKIHYKNNNPYYMEKGVSIPTVQFGKFYLKIYLDEGEKVWVQIIEYTSSGLGVEIKHFEYEGSGKINAWKVPFSPNSKSVEVMLWKEKYQFGEGPDPKNKQADELLTPHYFVGLVDSDSAYVK